MSTKPDDESIPFCGGMTYGMARERGILPRDYDNQIVKDRINRGEFYAIPHNLKSPSFFERNPWPPKQFKCGRCGLQYDGLVPKHDCSDGSSYYPDVFIYDFCTHCGDTFNQYDGRHTCEPYGRHARRVELPNSTTYYVRVFNGAGSIGKHHVVENPRISYQWVENLTGPSGFRYIGWAKGIERACLIMGIKPVVLQGIIKTRKMEGPDINALWDEFTQKLRESETAPIDYGW